MERPMPAFSSFRRSPLRWGAVAGLVLSFVGCALSRDGLLEATCTADAECTSANLCEQGVCTPEGICEFTPFDGEPAQNPGDCLREICQAGVLATEPDPADVPPDDGCTEFTCSDGTVTPMQKPQAADCFLSDGSEGFCDLDGVCSSGCRQNSDCPVDNKCEIPICNSATGECEVMLLDAPPEQAEGDCQIFDCDNGEEVFTVDNTDVPDDGNECTIDTCENGVPTHTPRPGEPECGMNPNLDQFCNAAGKCVGCDVAADCGTDTFCRTYSCDNEVCNQTNQNEGDPLPAGQQMPNDCGRRECSNGNATTVFDTSDPASDSNECTNDVCMAVDNTTHPPESAGTTCTQNGGNVCDGSGSCVECVSPAQCPNATDWTCNGNNECKKVLGVTCNGGSECNSTHCEENVCCNNACNGSCRVCDTGTIGQCADAPQFQACGNGDQCNDSGDCREPNGGSCSTNGNCASGFCASGTCCNEACAGDCKTCDTGTCGNEPQFTSCGSGDQCDTGGNCVEPNGTACMNNGQCASEYCVDSFCCSTATCGSNETCDTVQGDGVCRKVVGEMCNNDDECATDDCNTTCQ